MKVGFIGLGAMGAPMLQRLGAAYPDNTYAFDENADVTAQAAKAAGATVCSSIVEIAGACDVLFSCLPNNDVIRQVYLGDGGVAAGIKSGTVTIDCSTVGPDATREVYAGLNAKGVSHIDASMLGSVKQANEGTISFVVGGDEPAFDQIKPVLANCGELIRYCGSSGAGNHMKLIHQTLVAGHAVAVAEAMGLCAETGINIEAFYDIVTQGTGFAYSRYFENRVPRMREDEYSALFMLKFMLKDARLAKEMVEQPGDKYPTLTSVVDALENGVSQGFGEEDFSAVMKVIESRIGKSINAE